MASDPVSFLSTDRQTTADFAYRRAHDPTPSDELLARLARSSGVLGAVDLESAAFGTGSGCRDRRRRPGTAQGFFFVTLEDETGLANAILKPDVFQRQRIRLRRARTLKIGDPLQKVDRVIHMRPRNFEGLQLPSQVPESRDFQVIGYSLPRT